MRKAKPVKIIITLAQHPVLGALLMPYAAEENTDGTIQVTDPGNRLPPHVASKLNKVERQAIEIASKYSEKNLMKVFSKETIIPVFFKRLTDDDFKKVVRPFIDKKIVEMLELIRSEAIPFYQNEKGNKILYAHSKIDISPYDTDVVFDFEADNKNFHYSLQCYRNGELISLLDKKPVVVLTSSPATLLLSNELHRFQDISSMRILPFTNKMKVSVNVSETDKYLEKIVLPVLRHHDITFSGLRIFEEKRSCKPALSVEENVYDTAVLRLTFHYGDETFYPGSVRNKKSARMQTDENGRISILYFCREIEKEEYLISRLKDAHLTLIGDSHFRLRNDAPEQDLTDWITANRNMLTEDFHLLSNANNDSYCLDDICMEQEVTEKRDWFELHITVVIGKFRIPFIRFRKNILAGERKYLLPDGRIILLPKEWFNKYTSLLEHSEDNGAGEENIRIKQIFIGLVESAFSNDPKTKINYQTKEYLEPPVKLKTKLRQYQKEGFNWMVHLGKHHFGGCLADDMGLGKTLQTLSLLQYIYNRRNAKPASLIVMPTSLLHNWRKEIARFTALTVYEFTGASGKTDFKPIFDRHNLILISYGIMRNNIEILNQYCFEYVVLDESQHIKNSESRTFKAVVLLRSNQKLILTGTPIENSLKDLWSQFHFLQPDLLGPENAFNKRFINPIKQGDEQAEAKLQRLITPFILRRCKEEVAPELPPLTEEIIYCEMTEKQNEIYEKEKNSLRNILLQLKTDKGKAPNFIVLEGINRLRQLACHPRMVDKTFRDTSGKLQEIISTFETLRSEGHKALIFSSYVKHLEIIAEVFEANNCPYALLTGSSTNREEEIKRFTDTEKIQAFLISLKAGGVGLNLTQADYVFIIDPWWNPAAELQAICRAHRIGQNKQVFAYRFITAGSIEEKIVRLQEEKKDLFNTFITDNNPLKSLDDKEWAKLLEE
jgi:superfamily II DNA or RNA helicase